MLVVEIGPGFRIKFTRASYVSVYVPKPRRKTTSECRRDRAIEEAVKRASVEFAKNGDWNGTFMRELEALGFCLTQEDFGDPIRAPEPHDADSNNRWPARSYVMPILGSAPTANAADEVDHHPRASCGR